MLQFFKKSGYKESGSRSSQSSPAKSTSSGKFSLKDVFLESSTTPVFPERKVIRNLVQEEEETDVLDDDDTTIKDSLLFASRLSKTLPEILADKSALAYFIQFMDSRGCLALIKFWLEVECLRSSFTSQIESQNCRLNDNCNYKKELHNNDANVETHHDKYVNVNSNDMDLEAAASLYDTVNRNNEETNVNGDGNSSRENNIKQDLLSKSHQIDNCDKVDKKFGKNEPSSMKQDALRIYKKYIVKESLGNNAMPAELLEDMEKAFNCEDIELILSTLATAQENVYRILEQEHINPFLKSDFHCKHQIDVLTSGEVQLGDVLYNETALFFFMEFMDLENKRELLDFWMSVVHFKQNLLEKGISIDPTEAQADALIIYEKYFSLQATTPLGFSDKVRFHVEENICREDDKGPLPNCFDWPCKIVYNILNKHYLPMFLSSQLFYKYLSELISTIQSNPTSQSRIKRAGSDCSSSEISATTALSASTSVSQYFHGNGEPEEESTLKKMKSNNGNMSIDSRQLYDPDSLWKRNKYRLSVGYIDDMGRFVTEIEKDPHKKYDSRLTRAVKKLINIEQDKAKEELAWKIAEMIVREITTLTQGKSVESNNW